MKSIATLLAAPQESPLQELRTCALSASDIRLLQVADDGDPVRTVRTWRPDVVLLDGGAYGAGTIAVLQRIHSVSPASKPLVFCCVLSEQYVMRALNHGACGCLRIGTAPLQIVNAIRAVHAGELWAGRKTIAQAFRRSIAAAGTLSGSNMMHPQLSARELQIVTWMRRGMTNKEIGRELGISDATVKTHAHNIFHKMSISGRIRLLDKLGQERSLARDAQPAPRLAPRRRARAVLETV